MVDAARPVGFQLHAIFLDHGLAEEAPRRRPIPAQKIIQGLIVSPSRMPVR
jgi:hypothetical protein